MAFPTSPVTNQTAVVNGITYIYNATNGTWTRQSNGAATLGSLTLANSLIATGATINGTLTATTLTITGSGSIGGTLTVTGNITGSANVNLTGNLYQGGIQTPTLIQTLTYLQAF